MKDKEDLVGASAGSSNEVVSDAAAAHADMALSEHFERWWKSHAIHRQAAKDGHLALLCESYREVAWSAWKAALGQVPLSSRDERIERLESRAQYLRMKIFNDYRPHSSDFKRAELSALEWAIPIVIRATDAAASPLTSDALSTTEAPPDEPIEYRLDHDSDHCGENCKGH